MANYDIKKEIDIYFQDNWTSTGIQYQGETQPRVSGVPTDPTTLDNFISLVYAPVENESYGFDGSATGRIEYAGLQKIFCYAKNPTKAMQLADQVKTFFDGKEIGNIHAGIGQDGQANDLGNSFHEVLCSFDVSQWA